MWRLYVDVVVASQQGQRTAGIEMRRERVAQLWMRGDHRGRGRTRVDAACATRQIERVAVEDDFVAGMSGNEPGEIRSHIRAQTMAEVDIADDHEGTCDGRHGLGSISLDGSHAP